MARMLLSFRGEPLLQQPPDFVHEPGSQHPFHPLLHPPIELVPVTGQPYLQRIEPGIPETVVTGQDAKTACRRSGRSQGRE